jgi:hypothetical protein
MKKLFAFLSFILITSCQITETIHLNPDGSGTIDVSSIRDENSYLQLTGGSYSNEEIFKDTTYVFNDYIIKYAENFSKLPSTEKAMFNKYKDVRVYTKESSFEKEYKSTFTQDFNKAEVIADLYKTAAYAADLKHNYALSAEEYYYDVSFSFDGKTFKRIVKITDQEQLKKEQKRIENFKKKNVGSNFLHILTLQYHFPRKIKSVSNPKAIISDDKQSLQLGFQIFDCQLNPEIGNLEVVLE